MPDFPALMAPGDQHIFSVSTLSGLALGNSMAGASPAGVAWPAANRALFVPCRIPMSCTIYKMACGTGTGTAGNFDLGFYDQWGNLLVSTGTTGKTTASSERIVDVTDTFIGPGMYYLAMATDGVTGYYATATSVTISNQKLMGCREMETAFPLPSTATFATVSTAFLPHLSARFRAE